VTHQLTLDGNSKFIGSDHDKALYILTNYPEARNSYKAAIFWWWVVYDGLGPILRSQEQLDAFKKWLIGQRATNQHTIRNRIQEVQNEFGHLDASEEVGEWREKRSKQGVLE